MRRCAWCAKRMRGDSPPGNRYWCNRLCLASWEAAHPEEATGWVEVEDLSPLQHAELVALIGLATKA